MKKSDMLILGAVALGVGYFMFKPQIDSAVSGLSGGASAIYNNPDTIPQGGLSKSAGIPKATQIAEQTQAQRDAANPQPDSTPGIPGTTAPMNIAGETQFTAPKTYLTTQQVWGTPAVAKPVADILTTIQKINPGAGVKVYTQPAPNNVTGYYVDVV